MSIDYTDEYNRLERYVLAALAGMASNPAYIAQLVKTHHGDPDKVNEAIAQAALNVGARALRATAKAAIRARDDMEKT